MVLLRDANTRQILYISLTTFRLMADFENFLFVKQFDALL